MGRAVSGGVAQVAGEGPKLSLSEVLRRGSVHGGRAKRSGLHEWMRRKFDRLERELAKGTTGWDRIVAGVREAGFLDVTGKPPSKRTVQDTFYRVRAEKRLARSAKSEPRVVERVKWVEPEPVREPVRAIAEPMSPGDVAVMPGQSRGQRQLEDLRARLRAKNLPMPKALD